MTRVALDTNLLLLFVVGRATGRVLGSRLKSYSLEDYKLLASQIEPYERIVTTPHVLTELTNIYDRGIDGDLRRLVGEVIGDVIATATECFRPSRSIAVDPEFKRLGLADCAWLLLLESDTDLLTDDLVLYNVARSRGHAAINFTNLRDFN